MPSSKQAATAIRWLVILSFATTLRSAVMIAWRRGIVEEIATGSDLTTMRPALEQYRTISFWSHLTCVILIAGAALFLARSLSRGRGLAFGSAVSVLVHAALMIYQRFATFTDGSLTGMKLVWWFGDATFDGAIVLAIAAVAVAVGSTTSRLCVVGAGLFACLSLGYTTYTVFDDGPATSSPWIGSGVGLFTQSGFLAAGLVVAHLVSRSTEANALVGRDGAPPGRLDGAPLRALGLILLVRIGLGLLLQAGMVASMSGRSMETASTLMIVSTGVSGLVALAVIFALFGYMGYPASHRGEGLPVVMVLVVLAVILDVVAANAGTQLFDLVVNAQKATSFWGAPSLSEVESLQATLTWCGRFSLVVGVTAAAVLAGSLGTTARAVEDAVLAGRASRVRAIVLVAGAGALGMMFLVEGMRKSSIGIVMVVAALVLILAIYLLVEWVQLLFGLARAVETRDAGEPVVS